MTHGALTANIDVAQIVLYAFWIFFAGLVLYLLREGKREGYPLEPDRPDRTPRARIEGFPAVPPSKTYRLRDGRTVTAPKRGGEPREVVRGTPSAPFIGAPIVPDGDPMTAGVGPGAYAQRADIPDTTLEGTPRLVPLRAHAAGVAGDDPDPRGWPVIGGDGRQGGVVTDLWLDQAEMLFRYIEVEPAGAAGARVLLPINFARVGNGRVEVYALFGAHFAGVPRQRDPAVVTLLEEEKIMAYYGAGTLYASPERQEPLL